MEKAAATILALALLFLSMSLKKSDCLISAAVCNATVVGDCLPGDEEFMMESEVSRRLLARTKPTIAPPVVKYPEYNICHQRFYGSCVPPPNRFYDKRPCPINNKCDRNDDVSMFV